MDGHCCWCAAEVDVSFIRRMDKIAHPGIELLAGEVF